MRNVYFSFPFVRRPPEGLYSRHGHRLALWYTTHTHITTDTPEEVKKGDRRKIRQQLSKKGARAQTIQQHVPNKKRKERKKRETPEGTRAISRIYALSLLYQPTCVFEVPTCWIAPSDMTISSRNFLLLLQLNRQRLLYRKERGAKGEIPRPQK